MPRKKVKQPWFDWGTRWAPAIFHVDQFPAGDNIHWTVPDDTFLHMVGFTVNFLPGPGLRSTTTIMRIFRGNDQMFSIHPGTKVGALIPIFITYAIARAGLGATIDNTVNYQFELPDHIYLQPGDLLDYHLISPLAGDELIAGHVVARRYNA